MCGGNCRSGCGRAGERGFYGNNGYNGYARAGLYQPFVFPNTPSRPSNPIVGPRTLAPLNRYGRGFYNTGYYNNSVFYDVEM